MKHVLKLQNVSVVHVIQLQLSQFLQAYISI